MNQGLDITFQWLAQTDNEAADSLLIEALDSPHAAIQKAALAAILRRSSPAGHREVLSRLDRVDEQWKPIIERHRARLAPALRSAMIGPDPRLCANACHAAVWFREYDLVPALLNALEDHANPNGDLLARTLSDLVRLLCEELAGSRDDRRRDDPQLVRRRMVAALENSVKRFARHHRREVVEAFAALVYRDNITLKQVLENPHHAAFVTLMDLLARSPQGGIIRLLLSFLDDPQAPRAALSVVARRSDPKFVAHLLRRIGSEPSSAVAHNLKRIESIARDHGLLADGRTPIRLA
ncbi:MAG: hypothetical protein NUV77_23590, partial [Thermoguttaceae bacterium]|nr:hypothetical protein [Thermoguttaceae bacterium]